MSDLKITVTTEDAQLQALIDKLNAGTLTVSAYRKEISELTKQSIVGSKEHLNLKNVIGQVSDQTLTANGKMMKSYFMTGEALRVQQAFAGFLKTGFQSLGMETEKATAISESFGSKLGLVVGVVGVAIGVIMGLRKAFNMAEESARMELLQSTMQQMAEKDGINFAEVLEKINGKIGTMVSKYEILQSMEKFTLAGIGFEKMPEVLEFVEMRSKLIGKTFEETAGIMERAVLGGQRAVRQLLIPIDVDKSYKEYAKTLGILPDELTAIGKQHALFNAILEKGKEQHLEVNKAADAELEKYEKLQTAWKNLGEEAGRFARMMSPAVDVLSSIIGLFIAGVEKANSLRLSLVDLWKWMQDKFGGNGYLSADSLKKRSIGSTGTWTPNERKGETIPVPEIELMSEEDVDWDKVAKRKAKQFDEMEKIQDKAIKQQEKLSAALQKAAGKRATAAGRRAKAGTGGATEDESEASQAEQYIKNFNKDLTAQDQIVVGLAGAIDQVSNKWTNTIQQLINGTQNIGQAFKSMAQAVVGELEAIIAKMIAMQILETILGVITGGVSNAVTSSIPSASKSIPIVSGGFNPGDLVGKFSSAGMNNFNLINQISQASVRGSDGGNAQLLKAINGLQLKASFKGQDMVVALEQAKNIYDGRVMNS